MILRLLRLLLLFGIGYFIYKLFLKGDALGFFKFKKRQRHQSPKAIEEMKKDPVCGTYIPENQAIRFKRHNTTFYFCSEECKEKFRELKE